jgi:hypothetical protein
MRLTEAEVQAQERLIASQQGMRWYRNNVGVAVDRSGRPIRYGLANDSKALNQAVKSSDLIGVRPILITPQHVGTVIGQFIGAECKRSDWRYMDTPEERAQQAWHDIINGLGGYSKFITKPGTFALDY